VPVVEVDVSRDEAAARELMRRSGQMGVPVIVAGEETIVGFDRPRLERVAARYAASAAGRPRLGLLARDRPTGGVEVGGTRPDSPAARAGFLPGDLVEAIDGRPVRALADLLALTTDPARPAATATVRRAGRVLDLRLGT
jgi:S1-C subfamily serine protease